MLKRKIWISVLLIVTMLGTFGLAGCNGGSSNNGGNNDEKQNSQASQANYPKIITIGTATVGGAWFPMGGAMASLLGKYMPDTKFTATQSAASIENLNSIRDGKMEIGFATNDIPYNMYRAQGGQQENKAFRSLVTIDKIYLNLIVKKNSPIKKFEDIKGKKMGTGLPGSSNYIIIEELLKAHGFTHDDVDLYQAGYAQQATALKDGNIDMLVHTTGNAVSAAACAVDLDSTAEIRFIPISEEVLDKIHSAMPYYMKDEIPPGWVKSLTEPVPCLSIASCICIKADLPDEFVYDLLKNMFDNKDELKSLHPDWGAVTKENAAGNLPVPLHPGAEKFYKEIGAPISEL